MTTERLYYDDSYTLEFNAYAIEQTTYKQRPALVLDRTYFYPEGGGQPNDTGVINGVPVIDVQTREADRAVLHVLDHKLDDSHIEGQIDSIRRLDHMQHHSGQHVLSQALNRAANADTLSVHMSGERMTIDVNRPDLSPEEWLTVEELANQIVIEDRSVRAWFPELDELASLAIRKLPDVTGKVRIVDVGGFDITACGGTHVARTGEIGLIKVIKFERRGDTTRLEFKCGGRSIRDYRDKNEVINRLVTDMTVGYWELPDAMKRLQDENKALRSELKAVREQLVDAEALTLIPSAMVHGNCRIVVRAFENRDLNDIRLLAQKLTAQPGTIVLFGLAGDKAQLLLGRAENVSVDMVPILKTALAVLKSERGGGRPNFAQGGGVTATLSEVTAALHQAQQAVEQILSL